MCNAPLKCICVHLWRCTQVGRRGAPAKGVGRDNRRGGSNPLISAKKGTVDFSTVPFFFVGAERCFEPPFVALPQMWCVLLPASRPLLARVRRRQKPRLWRESTHQRPVYLFLPCLFSLAELSVVSSHPLWLCHKCGAQASLKRGSLLTKA